jgi:prepilin-type N-terminal cleavage/methylation domain-containing protein
MRLPQNRGAYTLLEVLLALGVVAILLGITIPYLSDSFRKSPGEEAADDMAKAVQGVRNSALEKGEARQFAVFENGIQPEIGSVPPVWLPKGWRLEIRRMTESKFRKPVKKETWSFNGAGICEPVAFKIVGPKESVEILFDPLTGLVIDE